MTSIDELLGQDEQVLYKVRQHWFGLVVRLLSHLALIALLVSAGVVSKTAFHQASTPIVGTFSASDLILMITLVISLFLLTTASSDYLHWLNDRYLVTDRRVIQVRGIFSMSLIGVPLENIETITITQDFTGRQMNYGTIEIATNEQNLVNVIENASKPALFKQAVQEAIQNYQCGYGYLEPMPEPELVAVGVPQQPIRNTIEELAVLRDRGILSTAEFEAKKRELLSRI
jgi:membrane protein YdbS with pleckstrin-like domain